MRLFLIISCLVFQVLGNVDNKFIIDYFLYKKVYNIVGFTCNSDEDNILLIKYFSKSNIKTMFSKLNSGLGNHDVIRTKYYTLGIFIDVRCNARRDVDAILAQATVDRMYDELHNWLIVSSSTNLTSVIKDETFDLSTDLAVAVESCNSQFMLYDVYNPFKAHGGKLNVTILGFWNNERGLSVILTENKYRRRWNLHGLIWRVSYFTSKYKPPDVLLENHLQDYENTGTRDGLPKFGYSVVKHLSEMYNTTVILRQYGTWKKGDRSGPMSRALESDEIDMTGSLISVIPEKLSMLKFVYPAWPFRTCFVFRSPQPRSIKLKQILGQFEASVWYSVLFVLVLMIFGLMLTLSLQSNQGIPIQLSNSILISIGSLCQQGTNLESNYVSSRMTFLNMMLFSLILYDYYSALVVSARLSEPIVKIKDSLISLAKSNLRVASEPMIYFEFLMKDFGKDAEYFNETKWQKVPDAKKFILPDKAMRMVQDGSLAYHTHPDVGYPYINREFDNKEICELTEVHLGKLSYRSIAIAYNSSFTEIAKTGFAWMSEVGIRRRQLTRWTSRKPKCRTDILSASSITIYEFASQLLVLLIGLICSILIFIGEILISRDIGNR